MKRVGRARRLILSLVLDSQGRLLESSQAVTGERAGLLGATRSLVETGVRELFLSADQVAHGRLVDLCRTLSESISVPFTVAHDLTDPDLFERLLDAGAQRVAICRAALNDPDLISRLAERAAPGSLTVIIASQKERDAWRVLVGAGGSATEWDAVTWARVTEAQGAGELIVQPPSLGVSEDYDLNLLASLRRAVVLPVVAGGEARTPEELFETLMIGDADGVMIGATLVQSRTTLRDLREFLSAHGLTAE